MRRLALAAALLLGSCRSAAPPVPPPALAAALQEADDAVRAGSGAKASLACEALSRELSLFKSGGGVPVPMQADLHQLSMEVAAFGAQVDGADRVPAARWSELRARLDRVLRGEAPTEGPRYQIDMPEALSRAVADTDAAFARGDAEGVREGLGRTQRALYDWIPKMPGPRAARLNDIAEGELTQLQMYLRPEALEASRATWERAKARMKPGAE